MALMVLRTYRAAAVRPSNWSSVASLAFTGRVIGAAHSEANPHSKRVSHLSPEFRESPKDVGHVFLEFLNSVDRDIVGCAIGHRPLAGGLA
jgi:hypothetical protein